MSELLAGTAIVPITPPVGVHLQGYRREGPCEGVRDNLHARALVLDDGKTKTAVVGIDLIGLEYESVLRVRERVGALCDVPPGHVMISASHTHGGPAVMYLAGDPMDWDYLRTVERQIAGAVVMASRRMQPVRVGYGEGTAAFNVNRRVVTPTGTPMLPNPDGVVDRRVRVIRVDGEGFNPLAVLFCYTCHSTVLGGANNRVSGDYPGAAERAVEQFYGLGTTAIFLPGCFGNIRPNLTTPEGRFRAGSDEEVERIGRTLAAEVVRVSEGVALEPRAPKGRRGKTGGLSVVSSVFRLPYLDLPSERKVKEMCRAAGERHGRMRDVPLERRKRGYAVLEISAMRIGDLSLVTLPGEVMLEIGQQVEAGLNGKAIVLGYTNGNPGYLCTDRSYEEGGYEPTCFFRTYHHPAPFTRETEKILVRTGIKMGLKVQR
ncbi:MAG: hypothetical protein EXS64_08750 [Candidatus Latescibacteria bacterium]|nr:hypothetical protein [Candidatus Latescibacterota bacterium]